MNPVAAICHLLAIVVGGWGGYTLMGTIAPDPPPASAEPGVASDPDAEPVDADAPESFLRPAGFAAGLSQLSDQLAPGEELRLLRVEPDSLHSEGGVDEEGLIPVDEIPADATENLVEAIHEQRPEISFEQISHMDLIATRRGPRWYVQIVSTDPDVTPPWTYTAPILGEPVEAGGAPPTPIGT